MGKVYIDENHFERKKQVIFKAAKHYCQVYGVKSIEIPIEYFSKNISHHELMRMLDRLVEQESLTNPSNTVGGLKI
ncbi:hypothetical protein [Apilactobacillus xinyiensis]|uniref:hypothetical protein n=1 Tax=Apilactobacillus xinyiensis TaxID=2841032 RepID=UPI00200F5D72|nr:hypothetical protein [Apilactobacillus xinyiensis]MCL0330641.1 hypothetical protein [Apilactobacillus xinyiensis]